MYDDLWTEPKGGARTWASYLDEKQMAWLEGLAAQIRAKGSEPFWKPVAETFKRTFPDAKPANPDTIRSTVRRLVEQ